MDGFYKAIMGGIVAIGVVIGGYMVHDFVTNDPLHNLDSPAIRMDDDRLTQIDYDDDERVVFGVVSDIHNQTGRARRAVSILEERGASYILVAGDLSYNECLRGGLDGPCSDTDEIIRTLEALADTNLPILVIPGNHERQGNWENAMSQVTAHHPNILDMTQYRVFDGDDVDVVSLPGYQVRESGNQRFIAEDGFYASPEFIRETGQLANGLDDTVFLLAHGAGRTGTPGPATIYSGEDVGDPYTTQMMYNAGIRFAVVGNIHEAAGLATTRDGRPVLEGEFVDEFVLNAGTLQNWRHIDGQDMHGSAALITVEGTQAKYDMIFLE